jgi:hypothetical protein
MVRDLADGKEYTLTMPGDRFKEELARSRLSYESLVGRLRMEKNGEMVLA